VKIEKRDFVTCWKALRHSERIFSEAIERKDFPKGSSEAEFRGYLDEIRITKEKIFSLISEPPVNVH
jgi:hypothetical protein